MGQRNASKPPLERAFRTAVLFGMFKSPDKETVLTPARVVEMQYTSTLGGLSYFDLEKSTASKVMVRMRNVDSGELECHTTSYSLELLDAGTHALAPVWFKPDPADLKNFWDDPKTTFLDINSKTALYPLFAAVSLFYQRLGADIELLNKIPQTTQELIWKDIVENQIFANCIVPYSALIANRVLAWYNSNIKVNISVVDIIEVRKILVNARPKLSSEEIETLWKWIFDAKSFSTVEERVALVMKEASSDSA